MNRDEYEQKLSDLGQIIEFGSYEQDGNPDNGPEPIKWVELSNYGGKGLYLSLYLLDDREYNDAIVAENRSWETCTLRTYLNDDFYNTAFQESEKSSMEKNSYGDYVYILDENELNDFFMDSSDAMQALPSYYVQDHSVSYGGNK